MDVEAGGRQLVSDLLVTPAVFAESMDDQHGRPCRVGRPMSDELIRAVRGRDVRDE